VLALLCLINSLKLDIRRNLSTVVNHATRGIFGALVAQTHIDFSPDYWYIGVKLNSA